MGVDHHRRNPPAVHLAFVRRVDESGDRDIKIVWLIVGVQYACFLLGLACFALNLLLFWLGF